MRPIYVEISSFGAFGGIQKIDFTKVGSGLFLISGETGAGKTTIFDAISYVLYGEMSGSVRDIAGVRSDFSDQGAETYVYLEFSYKNAIYKIRRNPSYIRPKLKGEGTVRENAKVCLVLPDGTVLSDTKSVKEKVIDLLGLTYSQWKQVAMIAQGEFTKCLHADGGERSAIFRNIFKTKKYEELASALKRDELILKRQCEDLSASLAQYLSGVKHSHDDSAFTEFNECMLNLTPETAEMAINILAGIVNAANANIAILKKEAEKYEVQLISLTKELESVKMTNDTILSLNKEKAALEELTKSEHKIAAEQKIVDASEKLSTEINTMLTAIQKHEEAAIIEKETAVLSTELKKADKTLSGLTEQKGMLEGMQNKNNELLKSFKDTSVSLANKKNELKLLSDKIKFLDTVTNDIKATDNLRDEYKSIKHIYDSKKKEHINKLNELNDKQDIFIRGQAGILAEGLTDLEPCPVCGSKSHPGKAQKIKDMPTEDDLKALKKKVERLDDQCRTAYNNLNTKITEGKERSAAIIKVIANLILDKNDGIDLTIQDAAGLVEEERLTCKNGVKAITDDIKRLETDEKSKSAIENEQINLQKQIKDTQVKERQLTAKIMDIKSAESQKKGAYEEIRKALTYESKDIAIKKIFELTSPVIGQKAVLSKPQNNFSAYTKEILRLRASIDSYNSNVQKIKAKIEALAKMTENKALTDTSSIESAAANVKARKSSVDEALREKLFDHKVNSGVLSKSRDTLRLLLEVEKQYSEVMKLSKTANGELKGKQKITLEMYVQRAYFNKVLYSATKRLLAMTNQRFELLKKQGASDLRDKSFALDLDVLDNYTGKKRDIKTLSGGESFMAALALALSLSDTIQMEAGGVAIDTMFIDEGFGTLSPEFLPSVIDVLTKLTEGDKLIGVISHVEMLKDAIDKQITVTKSSEGGSYVSMYF